MKLIDVQLFEALPYAGTTHVFQIYADCVRIWRVEDSAAKLLVDVAGEFMRGGAQGMHDVVETMKQLVPFADEVDVWHELLPVVERCLPYWGS